MNPQQDKRYAGYYDSLKPKKQMTFIFHFTDGHSEMFSNYEDITINYEYRNVYYGEDGSRFVNFPQNYEVTVSGKKLHNIIRCEILEEKEFKTELEELLII